MKELIEFKGQNGKLIVFEDSLLISKNTVGGFISQGGSSGDRRYFYKDIITFEYKKPTLLANGYFKVIIQGTVETNAKVGILSSSRDSMKDQNTIVLRAFSKSVGEETDKVYEIVMQKIADAKKSVVVNNSKMDDLKKLGELKLAGTLTEEEFQKEKEKILNR